MVVNHLWCIEFRVHGGNWYTYTWNIFRTRKAARESRAAWKRATSQPPIASRISKYIRDERAHG